MFRTVPPPRSAPPYPRRGAPTWAYQQPPGSRPASRDDLGALVLKGLAVAGLAAVAYKGLQALCDEDFGTGEFPAWFRRGAIDEHIALYGCRCLSCDHRVRRDELTVDHILAIANGGRTSRANAQVICLSCNSSKGARNSVLDYLRGRGR